MSKHIDAKINSKIYEAARPKYTPSPFKPFAAPKFPDVNTLSVKGIDSAPNQVKSRPQPPEQPKPKPKPEPTPVITSPGMTKSGNEYDFGASTTPVSINANDKIGDITPKTAVVNPTIAAESYSSLRPTVLSDTPKAGVASEVTPEPSIAPVVRSTHIAPVNNAQGDLIVPGDDGIAIDQAGQPFEGAAAFVDGTPAERKAVADSRRKEIEAEQRIIEKATKDSKKESVAKTSKDSNKKSETQPKTKLATPPLSMDAVREFAKEQSYHESRKAQREEKAAVTSEKKTAKAHQNLKATVDKGIEELQAKVQAAQKQSNPDVPKTTVETGPVVTEEDGPRVSIADNLIPDWDEHLKDFPKKTNRLENIKESVARIIDLHQNDPLWWCDFKEDGYAMQSFEAFAGVLGIEDIRENMTQNIENMGRLATQLSGMSLDRKGNLFVYEDGERTPSNTKDKKSAEHVGSDALRSFAVSVAAGKNPFKAAGKNPLNAAEENPFNAAADHNRIAVPITMDVAAWLASTPRFEDYTAEEIHQASAESFDFYGKPDLENASVSRQEVIYDMVEANAQMDNIEADIPEGRYVPSVDEAFSIYGEAFSAFDTAEAWAADSKAQAQHLRRSMKSVENNRKRHGRNYKPNPDGTIPAADIENNVDDWLNRVLERGLVNGAMSKFCGYVGMAAVIGRVTLLPAALYDNVMMTNTNWFSVWLYSKIKQNGIKLKNPSKAMLHDVNEAIKPELQSWLTLGNRTDLDFVSATAAAKEDPDTVLNSRSSNKVTKTMDSFQPILNKIQNTIVSGETPMTDWVDTRVFVLALCTELNKRGINISAEDLCKALIYNQDSLRQVLTRKEGQIALAAASQNSTQGITPVTQKMQRFFNKHPGYRILFGTSITWFPTFAVNAFMKFLPFSETAMVLLTYLQIKKADFEAKPQLIADALSVGLDPDMQHSINQAMSKALIKDMAKFGNAAVTVIFLTGLIAIMGFDDPDDDKNDLNPLEYKIGGFTWNLGWQWADVIKPYFMLAVVGNHYLKHHDADKALRILKTGLYDTAYDTPFGSVIDVWDLAMHMDKRVEEAQKYARDTDILGSKETLSKYDFLLSYLQITGLKMAARLEPGAYDDFRFSSIDPGQTGFRRANKMIYRTKKKDNTDLTEVSYNDAMIRSLAQRSDVVASIMETLDHEFDWFGLKKHSAGYTGYHDVDQPLALESQPINKGWYDFFSVPYYVEDGKKHFIEPGSPMPEGKKIEYLDDSDWTPELEQETGGRLIDIVEAHSLSYLKDNMFCVPNETREIAISMLYKEARERKNAYDKRVGSNYYYDRNRFTFLAGNKKRYEDKAAMTKANDRVYELIEKLKSPDLQTYTTKSRQYLTSTGIRYVYKEGSSLAGQPATKDEYLNDKTHQIEEQFYKYGDHKSNFNLINLVDDRGKKTFDHRPALPGQGTQTDIDFLKKYLGNVKASSGANTGENVLDMATGHGQITADGSKIPGMDNVLVSDDRSDVYSNIDEKTVYSKVTDDPSTWAGSMKGTKYPYPTTSGSSSGGSGWKSWGSGSGGSDYAPIIYSHPGYSINADKASTIYSKIPYDARFDYLRPGIETKGSREAYRREDF